MMCLTNGRVYEQEATSLRQVDFIMKSGKVSTRKGPPLAISPT